MILFRYSLVYYSTHTFYIKCILYFKLVSEKLQSPFLLYKLFIDVVIIYCHDIFQVGDPSAANDEGITALHNAICAGHIDIVKFLVKFGCDVNAQDSDGW